MFGFYIPVMWIYNSGPKPCMLFGLLKATWIGNSNKSLSPSLPPSLYICMIFYKSTTLAQTLYTYMYVHIVCVCSQIHLLILSIERKNLKSKNFHCLDFKSLEFNPHPNSNPCL